MQYLNVLLCEVNTRRPGLGDTVNDTIHTRVVALFLGSGSQTPRRGPLLIPPQWACPLFYTSQHHTPP